MASKSIALGNWQTEMERRLDEPPPNSKYLIKLTFYFFVGFFLP